MKLRINPDGKGFTLAELMVSVVIVGLLTAIVLPRLSMTKDRGFIATMQSDLRQFAAHEESYFYDNSVYTSNLGLLVAGGFNESAGVTLTVTEATATGWAATAAHSQSSGVECALFSGTAAPVGASSEEGVIACM